MGKIYLQCDLQGGVLQCKEGISEKFIGANGLLNQSFGPVSTKSSLRKGKRRPFPID